MTLKKVLIVDDSKLARVTLRKKLVAHGLEVEVAESAVEAFEVLPRIKPEMIFMDHLMPGISGFEAAKQIREMPGFAKTPIIMCTGKDHPGYLEEALAAGASQILSKPPVDEQLDAILKMDFSAADEAVETVSQSIVPEEVAVEDLPLPTETVQPVVIPGMSREEIEELCRGMIDGERESLLHDVTESANRELAAMIEQVARQQVSEQLLRIEFPVPVIPEPASPEVDREMIRQVVESALSAALAEQQKMLKEELFSQMQSQVAEQVSLQGTKMIDQDINSILDLRLSVVMAERFAKIDQQMEEFRTLSEKLNTQRTGGDGESAKPIGDKDFQAKKEIESQLNHIIERQEHLDKGMNLPRVASIAALVLSIGVTLGMAGIYLGWLVLPAVK
jgi:CheY-like chemotaxis protein